MPLNLEQLVQMFRQGGGNAAQGMQPGTGGQGMQAGLAPQGVGFQGSQPPVQPQMGAQGMQGNFQPPDPNDDGVLERLANAPIDPMKIMATLEQQGPQTPQAQAVAPAQGRNLQGLNYVESQPMDPRAGLAQFLGG